MPDLDTVMYLTALSTAALPFIAVTGAVAYTGVFITPNMTIGAVGGWLIWNQLREPHERTPPFTSGLDEPLAMLIGGAAGGVLKPYTALRRALR
jgi:hypothetical protein